MTSALREAEDAFRDLILGFDKIKDTLEINSKDYDRIKLILEVR